MKIEKKLLASPNSEVKTLLLLTLGQAIKIAKLYVKETKLLKKLARDRDEVIEPTKDLSEECDILATHALRLSRYVANQTILANGDIEEGKILRGDDEVQQGKVMNKADVE